MRVGEFLTRLRPDYRTDRQRKERGRLNDEFAVQDKALCLSFNLPTRPEIPARVSGPFVAENSLPSRKARQRNPSHFGSYCQLSPTGISSTERASIGGSGGFRERAIIRLKCCHPERSEARGTPWNSFWARGVVVRRASGSFDSASLRSG